MPCVRLVFCTVVLSFIIAYLTDRKYFMNGGPSNFCLSIVIDLFNDAVNGFTTIVVIFIASFHNRVGRRREERRATK